MSLGAARSAVVLMAMITLIDYSFTKSYTTMPQKPALVLNLLRSSLLDAGEIQGSHHKAVSRMGLSCRSANTSLCI
jgi:hypothetical protein